MGFHDNLFFVMMNKKNIHTACLEQVVDRIAQLQEQMRQFQLASNEETKSSAGDKYETTRAMMSLEKEKAAGQIEELAKLKMTLDGLDSSRLDTVIQHGSLIETNHGLFYLSVGLGQIKVQGQEVFVISPVSPLGKEFLNKKAQDQASFGPRSYLITGVA